MDSHNRDTTPASKYTDEQVSGNLDLFASIAYEYVKNYVGTFGLLCDYRDRVAQGGSLTVPMIRATLNCMRYDARVKNLPEPIFSVKDYGQVIPITRQSRNRRVNWLDLKGKIEVDEPEAVDYSAPSPFVKMPVTWHHDYGMYPDSISASRLHRVHPDSHALWDRETHEPTRVLWWRCKSGPHAMGKTQIILMDALEAAIHILQSRGYLKACIRCSTLADGKHTPGRVALEDWKRENEASAEADQDGGQPVLVGEAGPLADDGEVGGADLHTVLEGDSPPRPERSVVFDPGLRLQDGGV